MQPDLDALLHVAEQVEGEVGAADEHRQADQHPRQPLGRDVEHHDEDAEEEQRRAEVALADEDGEAGEPGEHDRAEVAATGELDAGEAAACQ